MNERPLIFLSNDDSYASRGFEAALSLLMTIGDVVAVVPAEQQSGMSHAFTASKPLYLTTLREEAGLEVYALTGTPVDCVKFAFDYLLKDRRVDLVVSGINHGSNAAVNVLYSGTMGAAIEGSFYSCPAVGLSLTDHRADADFDATVRIARPLLERLLAAPPALPCCLNVNVPIGRPEEIKGVRVCRQTHGCWREHFIRRENPAGREYFWLTGEFINAEPDAEDTDEWALAHGYAAIVPVMVDHTDYTRLPGLRAAFECDKI